MQREMAEGGIVKFSPIEMGSTVQVKSPVFSRWVGIPGVRRHRDKWVFGSFLDKTSGRRKIARS